MKKVFLIDDDVFITRLYENLLNNVGIEAQSINSGEDAIQRISAERPDLVVLDLHMPQVNGVEVLRYIRHDERSKNIPVIIFTSGYVKTLVEEVSDLGAERLIGKLQCKPRQLVEEIQGLLESCKVEDYSDESALDHAVKLLDDVPRSELKRFLELLLKDEREQARLVCLVHIYKIMYPTFVSALGAEATESRHRLADALKIMLEDLYTNPDRVNESAVNTLVKGLSKLNALCQEASVKLASENAVNELLEGL